MRIALVATGGFDRSGRDRIIPALLWLTERLARQHEVYVYVLDYLDAPATYPLAGATVVDLGRPRGAIRQAAALTNAVRDAGPFDVIHGYWAVPAGRLAVLIGRRLRIPSVVTLDSGEFVSFPEIGYGLQLSLRNSMSVWATARLASRVTVCSMYQAELAHDHGIRPDIIPLGVDTRLFFEHRDSPSAPPFRLLHVASLNPVKDQATLLRALQHVLSLQVDVTLDIVGEDTMGAALAVLARQLGVHARVTFHGFLATDRVIPLYRAADLFVLTSLHEAAGVVVLEAAACGLPIVGSAVGYIADWAPDRAMAVPPADPPALAAAIVQLLHDERKRRQMGIAAGKWARAHDADWTALQFEALYRELTDTTPSPQRSSKRRVPFTGPART
jgi:glycosyltransferase involved in cell wall biosynthesis